MKRLGEMLIERGWLTARQLGQALNHQKYFGGRLGTCLLELNLVSEERVSKTLADQLQLPTISTEELRAIDSATLEAVPAKVACRGQVVPFERSTTTVSVAVVDPRDLALQDELSFVTSKRIKVFLAPEVRIFEALEKHYQCHVEMRYQRIWDRLNRARYLWQSDAKSPAGPPSAAASGPGAESRAAQPQASTSSGSWEPTAPPEPGKSPSPAAPMASSAASSTASTGTATRIQPERLPQRPTEVEVPEEFRDALGAIAPAADQTQAPVESQRLATLQELQAALDAAQDRDQIAEALLGYLLHRFARVLLFMVRGGEAVGWMGEGPEVDQARLLAFELGFDTPSFFLNLREGSAYSRGPLPKMEGHRRLAEVWGGKLPAESLWLPIRLGGRLVAVAYGDQGSGPLGNIDLAELQKAVGRVSRAFEDLLRRKKGAKP